MFGHLSAEDFTTLLDGADPTPRRLSHLQSCARCREKFESVEAIRRQMTEVEPRMEESIPEPDWSEFRSDVRNALLSRSVRRDYKRGWTGGFPLKQAMAGGIAALLVLGLTITTGVLWNQRSVDPDAPLAVVDDPFGEVTNVDALALLAGPSQMDVLDDVLDLSADEAESLQMILEDLTHKGVSSQ